VSINYSTLVLSIADNVKTVGVKFYKDAYHSDDDKTIGQKMYVYKTTLDLEKGDHVIVKVGQIYKVVIVTHLSPIAKDDVDLKWVVQKLDATDYESNLANEGELVNRVRVLEEENRRRQFLEILGGGDELKALTFK